MKKTTLFILLAMLYSTFTFAQDDQMQKWMAYMTPGKEHQSLAKLNGNWVYTSKMWMDPAGEPQTTQGTATCEMLLDGRYSQMKVSGNVMGMPFNGVSLTAYDNGKKLWLTTWIDNMGTGFMYGEGKYDPDTKTIVYNGTMFEPIQKKNLTYRQNVQMVDDNHMVMEMFNTNKDGKEYKSMHVEYVRK